MIAGGTGLTPMFQIIKSSLADPTDNTQLALVYANVEETDIRECHAVSLGWAVSAVNRLRLRQYSGADWAGTLISITRIAPRPRGADIRAPSPSSPLPRIVVTPR